MEATETYIVKDSINGIDISSIQGIIDARAIRSAGFDFVYIKSSQYSRIGDASFSRNVDACRSAGLVVGAYHFCAQDTDPEKQMNFFYRMSEGLGSKSGELPPMIDWEFCTPSRYTDHPKHCVGWLEKAVKRATELWYPGNASLQLAGRSPRLPTIYTFPVYAEVHQPMLGQSELGGYPLTYASYKVGKWLPNRGQMPLHKLPNPFQRALLWQYSGNGGYKVPGTAGDCDRQVFTGSSGEWKDFLGLERPVDSIVKDDK